MRNSLIYYLFLCGKYGLSPLRLPELLSYFSDWKKSFGENHNSITDELPWLTFPAIRWLKHQSMQDWSIFEYGGGGSTLFFSSRVKKIITVEHDSIWFEVLEKNMQKKERKNWTGLAISPEPLTVHRGDLEDPKQYLSSDEHFLQHQFQAYASAIDVFDTFDLILVDGRARNACILHAIPKLKKSGFLIIDNAERQYYTQAFKQDFEQDFNVILDTLAPVPFTRFISKTLILQKK